MPKFALLVAREESFDAAVDRSVVDETYQILCSLGHSETEARKLLDSVLSTKRNYKDVEALLQAVYEQRQS
jgi:Holliday junction DNA helicase RuvA